MAVSRILPLLFFFCLGASGSRIQITNNGYRDIVVAISPDVPSGQANELLHKIKSLITKASADLYEATLHRSYFESVNIFIPQTWVNVPADPSTWETFQDAEVQIDLPNSQYGDSPYTEQLGGCGDPGQYIHLTPDYVMNVNSLQSKLFVREWARLRYGVFEEHGYTGDSPDFPMFYQDAKKNLVPNVCSEKPVDFNFDYGCHVDPQTGLYDSYCTYSFTDLFNPGSSMMSDNRMLLTATHFCDDENHNRRAKNKHNAKCNYKSVWSVISGHVDFAGTNNLPAKIDNLIPKFNVVRLLDGTRYVLVADVSGSMDDYNRIGRLHNSARRWIQYDICPGSSLGIVKFSTDATVLSDMTVVSSATRKGLMDTIPSMTEGWTCIGCGLQKAIDILSPGGKGGVIILMTDGGENVYPYITQVKPELIAAQFKVYTIAFGPYAAKEIEDLAKDTNGQTYLITDDGSKDEFHDALTGPLICPKAISSVQLFQKKYKSEITRSNQSNPTGIFIDSVIVDPTIGRELTFRIDYTSKSFLQSFSVVSPSGQVFDRLIFDDDVNLAYIEIPQVAEVGAWNFKLTIGSSYYADYVNLIVTSKSRSDSIDPITVECSVPSGTVVTDATVSPVRLVAVVKQGRNVVLDAKVQAYVERPDGVVQSIDLWDSGVGSDSGKNDGIYSRYYAGLTNVGRYNLVCLVSGSQSTYVHPRTVIGNFNRIKSGGSFRVETPLVSTINYPPGRVTDLKVATVQFNQMSLTIEWTAPGEQLDQGTATEYQIKYSNEFDDVVGSNFTSNLAAQFTPQDVVDGSLVPLESGTKQRVTLVLPPASKDVTFYIALRAVNVKNLASDASNIVSVQTVVVQQPTTQPPTTRPTSPTTSTTLPPTTTTPTTPKTTSTTTTNHTTTTTHTTTKSSTFTCASKADGNHPNPASACSTSFYMCSNGNPYLFNCASDMVFREDIGVCDWPSNVAACH